ncbi:MAG: hypothetical protein ACOYM1_10780 [Methylovulum sp.]
MNKQQQRDNARIESLNSGIETVEDEVRRILLRKPGLSDCGHASALLIEGIDEDGQFVRFCQACGY